METAISTAARAAPLLHRVRSRLAPSIVDLVFIFFAVAVPVALAPRLINADGDPARHLRLGEYMLEHGALLRSYPFSFNRTGEPFLPFEWGSEVLYALAHRAGGLPAVVVFAGLLLALTYALVAQFLRRRGVDPLLAYLTAIGAAVLGGTHWVARPHLFTFVGVAILLHLLERDQLGRRVWLFAPLFAIWANLHGGFVYGLIVIGVYLAGDLAEWWASRESRPSSDRLRYHAAGLAIAALATVLNPFGLRLHAHVLGFLGGGDLIMAVTDEFLSPDFHQLYGKLFLGALLIVVAALAFSRRRPTLPHLFLLLIGIAFALLARRNIPLFALTALPVLALDLDPDWRRLRLPGLDHLRAVFDTDRLRRAGASSAVVAALLILLALNRGSIAGAQAVPAGFDPETFPVAAVERARAAGLDGRMFNDFVWGGYLLYAWPEQQVFIDGGTDFYGEDLVRTYLRIAELRPGWRDALGTHDFSLVLVPTGSPLARELARDAAWSVWHQDATAVLLTRAEPTSYDTETDESD